MPVYFRVFACFDVECASGNNSLPDADHGGGSSIAFDAADILCFNIFVSSKLWQRFGFIPGGHGADGAVSITINFGHHKVCCA